VARDNNLTKALGDNNNDVVYKSGQLAEARARTGIAAASAAHRSGGGSSKYDRMDEPAKLQFQDLIKGQQKAQDYFNDVMKDVAPGSTAANTPALAHAEKLIASAQSNRLQFEIANGLTSVDDMVTDIAGQSKTRDDMFAALSGLSKVAGVDFADNVAVALQRTDAYKTLGAPKTEAAPESGKGGIPGRIGNGRGLFTAPNGDTQLLQPFSDAANAFGGLRRRMQNQTTENQTPY
jgi:hypothetical protein